MIFAIDFDGTCVEHKYPDVGLDCPGAVRTLQAMDTAGLQLILWTMRSGEPLQDAVDWFQKNDIKLFGINENPQQSGWSQSPKAYAHCYIDDAALGVPLRPGIQGDRPMVDWEATRMHVSQMIKQDLIIY